MRICVAVYRHGNGPDLAAFEDEEGALAWRTSIAKSWWEQEFPLDAPPSDEKIGETYFDRMAQKMTPEHFEFSWVEVQPRSSNGSASTDSGESTLLSVPTVHLNGTSRESLLEQLVDVNHALDVTMTALAKASPHGRDYYPQGDGALRKATREHESRCERIRSVQREIVQIAEALPPGRDRRPAAAA